MAPAHAQDHRLRRHPVSGAGSGVPDGRRTDALHELSRHPPPGAESRQAAPSRGNEARRPDRDARLERLSASRKLVRHHRHGRGLSHRQSAPVPRTDRLDHQPRRRPDGDDRSHLRSAPRGDGRSLADDRALCRLHRPRAYAGDQAQERGRLRGLDRRGRQRLRLGRVRRAHGGGPLLHLGHDRQSEGRSLFPSLERSALDDGQRRCVPAGDGLRFGAAGRADVSRQFVGPRALLPDARLAHGDARPTARRRLGL